MNQRIKEAYRVPPEHRRTISNPDRGDCRQGVPGTTRGDDRQVADVLNGIENLARVAEVDWEALQAIDCLADSGRHQTLRAGHIHAVARRRQPVDVKTELMGEVPNRTAQTTSPHAAW